MLDDINKENLSTVFTIIADLARDRRPALSFDKLVYKFTE